MFFLVFSVSVGKSSFATPVNIAQMKPKSARKKFQAEGNEDLPSASFSSSTSLFVDRTREGMSYIFTFFTIVFHAFFYSLTASPNSRVGVFLFRLFQMHGHEVLRSGWPSQ